MEKLKAVARYHLAHLARFSGREPRGIFWPWIGILFVAYQALMMLIVGGFMVYLLGTMSFDSPPAGAGQSVAGVPPPFLFMMALTGVFVVGWVVLIAAAVSRRLHDSNLRGWWGMLPLPFLVAGPLLMLRSMSDVQGTPSGHEDMTFFFAAFVNNFVYLAMLVILVLLLVRGSTRGTNRFGEPPLPL